MYFLYLLKSETAKRTYIGITANTDKRIKEHNGGQVTSTRSYRPYKLIYTESFETKTHARKRELALKNKSFEKEKLFKKLGII